jgi:thiol-disulfide isomerase/thioredoxin
MRKSLLAAVLAAFTLLAASPAQAINVHNIRWKNHAKTESLAQDAGHYVLVHFWASWCPPCRAEMPELAAWAKAHPNIIFVPISLDDTKADAAHFLKANKLTQVPLLMGTVVDATSIGVRAIPITMIIGPQGRVLRTVRGASPWGADTFSHSILESMQPKAMEKD